MKTNTEGRAMIRAKLHIILMVIRAFVMMMLRTLKIGSEVFSLEW